MCLQNIHVSLNKQLAKLKQHLLILCRNSGPGDIQRNITDFPYFYKQGYLNAEHTHCDNSYFASSQYYDEISK